MGEKSVLVGLAVGDGVALAIGVGDARLDWAVTVMATAVLTASINSPEDAADTGVPQALARSPIIARTDKEIIFFIRYLAFKMGELCDCAHTCIIGRACKARVMN